MVSLPWSLYDLCLPVDEQEFINDTNSDMERVLIKLVLNQEQSSLSFYLMTSCSSVSLKEKENNRDYFHSKSTQIISNVNRCKYLWESVLDKPSFLGNRLDPDHQHFPNRTDGEKRESETNTRGLLDLLLINSWCRNVC